MKSKPKRGRPPGKRYDAWLNIPIEKEFYDKFRVVAKCEGSSACQLARNIIKEWMKQKDSETLKSLSKSSGI